MAVNVCGLQAAESNRTILRYLQEANNCWGATPTTGAPREMRLTSSSLTAHKKTVTSNEIRADRMISSVVATSYDSGGDIHMELAAGNVDDFMAAFVLGAWTRPMTYDNFSGSAVTIFDNAGTTEFKISGPSYVSYFTVGRRLKSEGFVAPVNNDFWQIASVSFAAGVTTVVTTGTTAITEVGTNLSKVFDANDVIVLKNTTIRAGTLGAKTFDSNGTNAFASAIIAKQLQVGQRIHVLGLGYGVGNITLTAQPLDGEIFTITDGPLSNTKTKSVVFEFDNNSAYTRGRTPITIGATFADTAANIQKAVMNLFSSNKLYVSASVTGGVVTLRNVTQEQGGSITEAATNVTATTFTGGSATQHGVFSIAALTDDVITVNETVATNANATNIAVTIKGSHLRNPSDYVDIKPQSFSIETGFTDVSQYFMQTGMRVGGFDIKVQAGALLHATLSLKGKETVTRNVTTLGTAPYTPLAATSTSVMNATTNVGSIYKNGVELTAAIHDLEIKGSATLREQMAVGSKFAAGVAAGRFHLTGKFSSYFETLELYDDFLNHNTIGLAFSLTDNENNSYWFNIPSLKITSDPIAPGAIDTDIMEHMDFSAIRDEQLKTQFIMDRFSSVVPATS
jgi:Phage tail tube protein